MISVGLADPKMRIEIEATRESVASRLRSRNPSPTFVAFDPLCTKGHNSLTTSRLEAAG